MPCFPQELNLAHELCPLCRCEDRQLELLDRNRSSAKLTSGNRAEGAVTDQTRGERGNKHEQTYSTRDSVNLNKPTHLSRSHSKQYVETHRVIFNSEKGKTPSSDDDAGVHAAADAAIGITGADTGDCCW